MRRTTVDADVGALVRLKCSSRCGISTDVLMHCVQMPGSWIRGEVVQSSSSTVTDR
jgi:hypothetical protein